jgi:hypothetical protein
MTPIAKLPAYLKQPPSLLDCGKCLAIVIGADMSETAKQAASYADLLDLPEHLVGEILAGQLHTHPRPAPKHAIAYSALGGNLWNPFQHGKGGPGGWWIIDEPELHLGADILVPDLAGWRRQRMPELPDAAYFELAPDWVCDTFARSECGPPAAGPKGDPHGRGEKIISPSTARKDRVIKMPLYARKQVQHLWLVDPDLRALEVYELREGHWSLQASLKDDDGCVSRLSRPANSISAVCGPDSLVFV